MPAEEAVVIQRYRDAEPVVPVPVRPVVLGAVRQVEPHATMIPEDTDRTLGHIAGEVAQARLTGVTVYGVEGPGWPLHQEWADPYATSMVRGTGR